METIPPRDVALVTGNAGIQNFSKLTYRVVKGGGVPRGGGSLIFPKVPQSSLGILRVPQLPPLEHPPP